jgi:hypothetical protein
MTVQIFVSFQANTANVRVTSYDGITTVEMEDVWSSSTEVVKGMPTTSKQKKIVNKDVFNILVSYHLILGYVRLPFQDGISTKVKVDACSLRTVDAMEMKTILKTKMTAYKNVPQKNGVNGNHMMALDAV